MPYIVICFLFLALPHISLFLCFLQDEGKTSYDATNEEKVSAPTRENPHTSVTSTEAEAIFEEMKDQSFTLGVLMAANRLDDIAEIIENKPHLFPESFQDPFKVSVMQSLLNCRVDDKENGGVHSLLDAEKTSKYLFA